MDEEKPQNNKREARQGSSKFRMERTYQGSKLGKIKRDLRRLPYRVTIWNKETFGNIQTQIAYNKEKLMNYT